MTLILSKVHWYVWTENNCKLPEISKNNPKWICFRYRNLIWARLKMSRILIQRKILFLMEMLVWTIPTVSIFLIILTNKTRSEVRFHKYQKPLIWPTSAAVFNYLTSFGFEAPDTVWHSYIMSRNDQFKAKIHWDILIDYTSLNM